MVPQHGKPRIDPPYPTNEKIEYLSSMHSHVCTMEFCKRGTPVASATPKFACCRMCARLQDHCDGNVLSSCLLPARKKKEKHKTDRDASPPDLARRPHNRPPMQGVLAKQAGQGRWSGTLQEHDTHKGHPGVIVSCSSAATVAKIPLRGIPTTAVQTLCSGGSFSTRERRQIDALDLLYAPSSRHFLECTH